MKYAIIKSGGKQYKVEEGQEILVDKLHGQDGERFTNTQVLLIRTDKDILVGQPFVENGVVVGKILDDVKGQKIRVSKFKAKVNYRKTIGFRPMYTKVLIERISVGEGLTVVKKRSKLAREKENK